MIKVILHCDDFPRSREVRMFPPRDGIARAGCGSILGSAHGSLPSVTSHHPLWFKQNPNTKKSRGATANSGNADKAGVQPLGETAEALTESVVADVAVWATSKRTSAKSKVSRIQSVDPVDTRLGSASIASVANVACPSPGGGLYHPGVRSRGAPQSHNRRANRGNRANFEKLDEMHIGLSSRRLAEAAQTRGNRPPSVLLVRGEKIRCRAGRTS